MRVTVAAAALLAAAFVEATSPTATASGPFLADRGVRPLGRAGAFVAGADDLGAIWYNPAGIVDAPASLLIDASVLANTATFTRQSLSTSATGTTFVQSFPSVTGSNAPIPIPTIAASFKFGARRQYAVALGVYVPSVSAPTYPQTIANPDGSTAPAPQRYSVVSLSGSALVVAGAWFAYRPIDSVRLGAGVQLLTGTYKSTADFSACPQDNLVCAAEDPSYDAYSQLTVGPIVAPSGNAGVIWVPSKYVRVGLSGQAPFWVNSPGTIETRLPSAAVFENASQQGTSANVHFELPPIARAGVELRPFGRSNLRIEVAYVREFWSVYQSIDVQPNIALLNVTGFPSPFALHAISIPLGGQDADSIRLGGEYEGRVGSIGLRGRAGVAYETSGIKEAYVSPLGIDGPKVTTTVGASLLLGKRWRLDAVYAHVFLNDVTVTPQEAAISPVNPVQGNPTPIPSVNGGKYHVETDIVGLGMQYAF